MSDIPTTPSSSLFEAMTGPITYKYAEPRKIIEPCPECGQNREVEDNPHADDCQCHFCRFGRAWQRDFTPIAGHSVTIRIPKFDGIDTVAESVDVEMVQQAKRKMEAGE